MWRRALILFKDYAHQVATGVGLLLFFELGQVATYKFAMDRPFPNNWGEYLWILVVMSGVNVAGMGVLRATGASYMQNKAVVEAAKAGATPPPVNVQGGDVNIQNAPQPVKPAAPVVSAKRPVVATTADAEDDPGII